MIDARLAEAPDRRLAVRRHARGRPGLAGHPGLPGRRRRRSSTAPGSPSARPPISAPLIQAVQDLGSGDWHGLPASRVWSLWTRYACTAFYAHPWAWNEIGFPGPAYPRGYKNKGVGRAGAVRGRATRRPGRRPGAGGRVSSQRPCSGTNRRGCCPTTAPGRTTGCAATCGASPTTTRSTWSSSAAARAARCCCSGWPGPDGGWPPWTPGRSGTRTRDWVSDEAGVAPPVLDRAAGDHRGRPGAARLEQLGPRRRRLHGALRRLHAALPSQRLPRPAPRTGSAPTGRSATATCCRTTQAIEEELPVAGEHWPWGDPHGYPHRPHPVGGNGEVFLRGARKLGITAKVGPVAIPNGRFGNRPHCIYRGFCLQGCKVNAKASPLITPHPGRPGPRRRGPGRRHGDPDRGRRADRAGHRRALRPRRPGAVPAGPDGGGGRLLDRDAPAAAELLLQPLPGRPVQRLRPGRPLPHGAGRAADRGPVRRRDPDVQGAAARGQLRGVLRDRPGQALPARVLDPERVARCRSPGPSTSRPRGTGAGRCATT